MKKYTNALINASSPYLLQHANNPVNWVEWSQAAFDQAKKENKLVLISVGYSACHWCHVMEKESFEDAEVAELMNKHLVCIKVDREERPDVDQIYMNAVQLMTQKGGWPLNCFTLPDGRPIFGGTYFPKKNWMEIIQKLWKTFQNDLPRVEAYAKQLTDGVIQSELVEATPLKKNFEEEVVHKMIQKWKQNFDFDEGGNNRAPKFPLPNNYLFLLRYGHQYNDKTVLNHVHKSLKKMALGGIYDQIGGGFSRYAVDYLWKVPHFEKMLYDNAQLLSTYAKAYQHTKDKLYKDVIEQAIHWLLKEMRHEDNGFFTALDADSEGVEGKFYTWSKEELKNILGADYTWFKEFYNVNEKGFWENNQYILLRKQTKNEWCADNNISNSEFEEKLKHAQEKLLHERNKRVRPGLDDKQLTAWNAMAVKGLIDAGLALQNNSYLTEAIKTGEWLVKNQINQDTLQVLRTRKNDVSKINGFLEDYAHCIDAFISLYTLTFEERWIDLASKLTEYTHEQFYDSQSKMFFFTDTNTELLTRKLEVNDNVIPSSNSVMALNLFKLGSILHKTEYLEMAQQMLSNIYKQMPAYGSGYSNWGLLALSQVQPFYEIGITGVSAQQARIQFGKFYLPNTIFSKGKAIETADNVDESQDLTILVCENKSCMSPVHSINEALKNIQ
ncbi:thioredoxin domain-containing protein [Brumimicrobium salinarum]|uniref:Thioredoxin domain-containing protein n=1 Tax=Brumimicrobium salinarum TaxID=2058658 RepID=A0A2I0QZV1_9FLAO|nr:thioredoxin domain-containing protein [Brumimicrobium salinarum]PKR79872.1 thioredoxin domain-containing protein [Brumimicrobium salinarum]